jgi:hypothetical protein
MTAVDLLAPVNPAGWPRPRMDSVSHGVIPAPWIADITHRGQVNPIKFDHERTREMERHWLCQVCGRPCHEEAWAPVVSADFHAEGCHEYREEADCDIYEVSGGPVCSERCCRLAVAFCPHFKDGVRLIRFDRADAFLAHPNEGMSGPAVVVKAWGLVK